MIVTDALALLVVSAALTAVSVTGFVAGTATGARKSMVPGAGPVGLAQGFDPVTQTCPSVAFPLATPSTSQLTA